MSNASNEVMHTLQPNASDEKMELLLAFKIYIGTTSSDFKANGHFYKRKSTGQRLMWEQLMLAARAIAAIADAQDILLVSSRPYGFHAGKMFAKCIGCHCITARLTSRSIANQITKQSSAPKLLIITEPHDAHVVKDAVRNADIPVIALAESDSPLKYADCVSSSTNKGRDSRHAVAFLYWLLAREVLCLKNATSIRTWNVLHTEFVEECAVSSVEKSVQRGVHISPDTQLAEARASLEVVLARNAALEEKIDRLKARVNARKARDAFRRSAIETANSRMLSEAALCEATARRPTVVTFADLKCDVACKAPKEQSSEAQEYVEVHEEWMIQGRRKNKNGRRSTSYLG